MTTERSVWYIDTTLGTVQSVQRLSVMDLDKILKNPIGVAVSMFLFWIIFDDVLLAILFSLAFDFFDDLLESPKKKTAVSAEPENPSSK